MHLSGLSGHIFLDSLFVSVMEIEKGKLSERAIQREIQMDRGICKKVQNLHIQEKVSTEV